MSAKPRERMLRLLSLLQSGRRWSAADLAQAMEATPRTLRRDLDQLRELGYPVESVRGPGGYYRLVAGQALPPLMLDDEEAAVAMLGLTLVTAGVAGIGLDSDAAARATEKLTRVLPPRIKRRTDALLTPMDIARSEHPRPHTGPLMLIADAITTRRRISFGYRTSHQASRRDVEPARLVHMNLRWYLYAWDNAKDDWRTFRVDRITDTPVRGTTFTPRRLPADDLVTHLREQSHGVPEHSVVLTLNTSVADAASRLYRIDGDLEPLDDQHCRYTAYVDSYQWLSLVLIFTDIDFTVEHPEDFRSYLASQADRFHHATARHDTPGMRRRP